MSDKEHAEQSEPQTPEHLAQPTKAKDGSLLTPQGIRVPAAAVNANQVQSYTALAAFMKIVSDGWNDAQAFSKGKRDPFSAFAYFGNLAPDFIALITNVQSFPTELKAMDDEALDHLLTEFATQMQMPTDNARAIMDDSLRIVRNAKTVFDSIKQLVQDIRNKSGTADAQD